MAARSGYVNFLSMVGAWKRALHTNFTDVSFTVILNATTKMKHSVNGKTMVTLLEKTRCNTAYLRRHGKMVEMWECEWKDVRNDESGVKTFLAP